MNEPQEPDELGQTASTKGGQAVNIRMVGFDKPFLSAVAVALSLMSFLYAFKVDREQAQEAYWRQRTESFLETLATQGYKVPADLLPSKGAKQ